MTDFQAIDSYAVGDGSNNAEPADTWLQNRIVENVKAVAVGHDAFSVSYANNNTSFTENLGDRPFASLSYVSFLLADLPDWNRLTGVRITMLYNCQSPNAANPSIGGTLQIKLDGKTLDDQPIPSTYDAGASYSIHPIDIALDEPLRGNGRSTIPLELSFRSKPAGAVDGVGFRVVSFIGSAIRYVGSLFTDPDVTGPVAASFETRYVQIKDGVGAFDVLGAGPIDGEDSVYVWPTPETYAQVQWEYMSYLQVRAIHIKPIFADDSAGQLPSTAYEPNKVFGGVEAQRAANAITRLESRPRVLSIGPCGKFKKSEFFDSRSYPVRWGSVAGDDATLEKMISDVAFLRTENPKIRITMRYISINVSQTAAAEQGESTWDVHLEAKYSDGTSLGTSVTEADAVLYPSYLTAPEPILRTWQFATNQGSDLDFAYKEGSLYSADLPLIRTAVFDVELTGHDTISNMAKPVEISAAVELNNVSKYCSVNNDTAAHVWFVLVGYTITEVPQ